MPIQANIRKESFEIFFNKLKLLSHTPESALFAVADGKFQFEENHGHFSIQDESEPATVLQKFDCISNNDKEVRISFGTETEESVLTLSIRQLSKSCEYVQCPELKEFPLLEFSLVLNEKYQNGLKKIRFNLSAGESDKHFSLTHLPSTPPPYPYT